MISIIGFLTLFFLPPYFATPKPKRKKAIIIFSVLITLIFIFKYNCYHEEISNADRVILNNYLLTFKEFTIKQTCENDPIKLLKLETNDEKIYITALFSEVINKPLNYGDLQYMSYKIRQYRREKN
ncbi:hypothetical protein [Sulfurovum sp.]|uniref:hypothetical protein n=1 Tax=Sulfurovum sp. TaxID=1969726 RepID=UPI00356584EB